MPIAAPPLKPDGSVQPHDHPEVFGDDIIIRKVAEQHLVTDADGRRYISSILYQASDGEDAGLSVNIEKLIAEDGRDPKVVLTTPRWFGSVSFTAAQLRAEGLMVGYSPLPGDKSHGEVWGNFSKAVRKRLRSAAVWYVPIPDAFTE